MERDFVFKAFLFLLGVSIARYLWPFAIGAIILWLLWYGLFIHPKISKLQEGTVGVIQLNKREYAVPVLIQRDRKQNWKTKLLRPGKTWIVQCIRPELQGNSVSYSERSTELSNVTLADDVKAATPSHEAVSQMSPIIKELHCKLRPKLEDLYREIGESERMEMLISSSSRYASKSHIYSRVTSQLNDIVADARALQEKYEEEVKETLIGLEVSKYESVTSLPDPVEWKLEFQEKYRAIDERHQRLKGEIEALDALRKEMG